MPFAHFHEEHFHAPQLSSVLGHLRTVMIQNSPELGLSNVSSMRGSSRSCSRVSVPGGTEFHRPVSIDETTRTCVRLGLPNKKPNTLSKNGSGLKVMMMMMIDTVKIRGPTLLSRGSRTASSAKRKTHSRTEVTVKEVAEGWTKTQRLKGCKSLLSMVDNFEKVHESSCTVEAKTYVTRRC